MLDDLLFSLNIVTPLFVLIILGFCLRRSGFVQGEFFQFGNKVVFYIGLPVTLFRSVAATDMAQLLDIGFVSYAVIATVVSFAVIWAAAHFFIEHKAVLGAFVQGSFRANIAFMGIPLMISIAGAEGLARAALVVTVVVPFYNICSVLVLSACMESEQKFRLRDIIMTILKNPLVIGIAIGIAAAITGLRLPTVIAVPVDSIAEMASPLALICLGGGIAFQGFDNKFKYALIASITKVIVLPVAFTSVGFLLGYRGVDLAAIMVLGGTPSAITGYVTAIQMGADGYTAGTIIVISTAMSALTLTVFIYILRVMGMIG